MFLGLTIGLTIAGQSQKYVNYVPPYMIFSAITASVGCGLLLTWTPHTARAAWICELGLFGIGQGLGWQQPLTISQIYLPKKDLPIGTTLMSACKLFGGAIFLSVGSSVFSQHLVSKIEMPFFLSFGSHPLFVFFFQITVQYSTGIINLPSIRISPQV